MTSPPVTDSVDAMTKEDYFLPAEIFVSRWPNAKHRGLDYHRFATAMEAIEFAVAKLSSLRSDGAVMIVEDKRFDLGALRTLHRAAASAPAGF